MFHDEAQEETYKRKKRSAVAHELSQLITDFAILLASDQPKYEGKSDETAPLVLGVSEDEEATPKNSVVCFNLANSNFVANSETFDHTFCLDDSEKTDNARRFFGMCLDTVSMYHVAGQKGAAERWQRKSKMSKNL